jgi:hypothetical protein
VSTRAVLTSKNLFTGVTVLPGLLTCQAPFIG